MRFRTTFLDDPSGEVIDAMKVIKIVDGIEGCCVGFLPRRLAADHKDKIKDGLEQGGEFVKDKVGHDEHVDKGVDMASDQVDKLQKD